MIYSRTKRARAAPPRIRRAAASVFETLAKKTRYVDPTLAVRWGEIVGEEIAALCRPGRLTGRAADRTLEIRAPSGAAAAKVQMLSATLLERVNAYLGPGGVARVAIRQAAASPAPQATAPSPPEADEPLGAALSAFRRAVEGKNRPK